MPAEALLQLVQVYNDALSRVAEAWFEPVGPRSLKNIAEPVELFEARSRRRVLRRAS
jgi:class 3 adenylate cyclase